MTIVGDHYPPPLSNHYLAMCVMIIKLVTIALILFNINPFNLLGVETPAFWTWLSTNKTYGCLMMFFICNTIEGQLISTGAFEITYNGENKYHLHHITYEYLVHFRFSYMVEVRNWPRSVTTRTIPNNR